MVVLVTGANGQLGQSLQFIAKKYSEIEFIFYNSTDLDITNIKNCETIFEKTKPVFCINTAAYTAVDKAESEPEKAESINVIGAKNLAETCKKHDVTLIHISTDFVFDGEQENPYNEEDTTNPKNVYGQTKLNGENAIKSILTHFFIIRTSWVYSQFGNNFMKTMLKLASQRDSLSIVNDQIGTPTHAVDLATVIIKIITETKNKLTHPNYGTYHFSNDGQCSWYYFTKKIFELNNVKIDLKPIPSSSYPTPAYRPKYSVLDKTKIKTVFKIQGKYWEESLKETLENKTI